MLTLDINENEVEQARLVKEVRQNSTSPSPICQNFAEFEVVPNKAAWTTQASLKVWPIPMPALSTERGLRPPRIMAHAKSLHRS